MLDTIIGALLPIVITLLLGVLAGWHKDFNIEQATILNQMVMLYALPLTLFSSMILIPKEQLVSDWGLFFLICIAMIGGFLGVFLISRIVFKQDLGSAALQALAISGPAVPFVGVPVLGYLFGIESAVAIAISSIIMNLFQVPVSLVLLSISTLSESNKNNFYKHILNALRQPVVWAPLLALVFIVFNIQFPTSINDSLTLLGKATGGVALFASGIVLFAQRVTLNFPVVISVISRNIIIPFIVWLLAMLLQLPHEQTMESVLSMAIPTASITVILAVQYHTAEREMASILFISTTLSIITMGLFIWLLK
ncbi:permease [Lawsonia intracellularis]|uniref:AEC family transporter n=1 Tax=Lawsonia intracellularis TaxID=29546 RepID=UPI000DE22046|nr:AEC family transporter [Lawsonia intracellularis]RBN33990.1 permease [Lawsonia intracellularis]RBN34590.1 permease [Lawsonia intracellularis]